jgi:phosphate transport system substrate-binding protein
VTAAPDLLNIPLAISAQLIAYNIPGVTAHLKLTGKVLSSIYQGKITNWNASAIAALNPGVTLPNLPIVTLHRSDSSGDTFLFTPSSPTPTRTAGARASGSTPRSPGPTPPGPSGEMGNSGMVAGLQGHAGLHRLRRHQLPDPGPAVRARLRPAAERQAVRAPDPHHRGRGGGLHEEDAGQRHHLAHLRQGQGRLPDHQLRVRHRERQAEQLDTAKNIRSVLEWASTPRTATPEYLSQVNFQPLPAKVVKRSR